MLIVSEGSLNGSLSEPDLAGILKCLLLTSLELINIPWGQQVLKHLYHPLCTCLIFNKLRYCQVYYFITPLTKLCIFQYHFVIGPTKFTISLKNLISFCSLNRVSKVLMQVTPACGQITSCAIYSSVRWFEMEEACVKQSCFNLGEVST